jgi:hypothetical protein
VRGHVLLFLAAPPCAFSGERGRSEDGGDEVEMICEMRPRAFFEFRVVGTAFGNMSRVVDASFPFTFFNFFFIVSAFHTKPYSMCKNILDTAGCGMFNCFKDCIINFEQ